LRDGVNELPRETQWLGKSKTRRMENESVSPSQIDIRQLKKGEGKLLLQLLHVFQEAFQEQDPPTSDPSYLNKLLDRENFIVYAAVSDGQVLGGLTAYELPMYYDRSSEIFVYDIGIGSAYQRKGLGKLLLANLKAHALQRGISNIFVAAHEEDQHALDFYRGAGWAAEKVVHFSWEG
jgi:aminoglycoside 3-N-acetyltransferase I